ncbi:MAG: RagB/SusD family nutrient uptake outer membrane protein, partial [Alloprevotella sp.]
MKHIKMLFMGLMTIAAGSCSDFLDHTPDERTEIDSEDKVVSLLIASYPGAAPCWLGEISSDNLIDNQTPHLPSSTNDKQILSHYNYSHFSRFDNELYAFEPASTATYNDYDSPGMIWGEYYASTASVNHALEAIRKMKGKNPDPAKFTDKLKCAWAEAHLLRAYNHFMLVNLFAQPYKDDEVSKQDVGVPYVTTVEDVVSKDYDRSNVAETYRKIGEDLEEGLKYVSDYNFNTALKYHFNVNAAHAFAARYYLFARKYEKVIEHANAVLSTDSAQMQRMMMDYSVFGDCSSSDDFAKAWQHPDRNNNLMLLCTNSLLQRRSWGYRYSVAGPCARGAMMIHQSPLWSGYICPPQAVVAGMLFSSSASDYGFISSKIFEEFEYADKIAGTGFPHIIYRAFTSMNLLLERAEAEIMLGRYEDAKRDLKFYWNSSINSMSPSDYKQYVEGKYLKYMTDDVFDSYYSKADNYNCFENWDFTRQLSSKFVVPADATALMNCLNDFRRYENVFEGMRYFDIKRWGLPVSHIIGLEGDSIGLEVNDPRRAIEVPWEAISAGMESSRTPIEKASRSFSIDYESLR